MRMTNMMAIRKMMAVKKTDGRPKTAKKLKCNMNITLALSWCPSKGNPRLESVLHGAWPPNEGPEPSPEPYVSPEKSVFSYFPKALKLELRRYMPNLMMEDFWRNHYIFWQKQWNRHGKTTGLTERAYFRCLLYLYHRVPNIYALGLTPGKHLQVKDIRRLVKMAFNAMPQVIGSMRTRGLLRGFEVDELRFSIDKLDQFVDSLLAYGAHLKCTIESIGFPEEPIKKGRAKKKNHPPRERRGLVAP